MIGTVVAYEGVGNRRFRLMVCAPVVYARIKSLQGSRMKVLSRWMQSSLLLVLSLAMVTGCAEQVSDIDRTQPNAIKKSDLSPDDEWYYQRTVVDVPASSTFTFVGATDYSGMTRIKWDIQ
jgi:hypothetical protein